MLLTIAFISVGVISLTQWYFDRRAFRSLDKKYKELSDKIAFPAEKRQLIYFERYETNGQFYDHTYHVNTVDELLKLIEVDKPKNVTSWSVKRDDEFYGNGWGDLASDK